MNFRNEHLASGRRGDLAMAFCQRELFPITSMSMSMSMSKSKT